MIVGDLNCSLPVANGLLNDPLAWKLSKSIVLVNVVGDSTRGDEAIGLFLTNDISFVRDVSIAEKFSLVTIEVSDLK